MSFVIVASVGLGLAAAGGVTKSIMGKKQRDEANAIADSNSTYTWV